MVLPAVGLILGTRLWYAMWDAIEDDDAAFERRASPVLREIGDRCKVVAAKAGQQPHRPPLAPSSAPTRQVAQAQTPDAGAPHGSRSSSLSNQQREKKVQEEPTVAAVQRMPSTASSMTSGSFAEMAGFIREERAFISEERAQIEAKLEAQRQEWEAKLEAQRQEWEAQRQEWEAKLEKAWTAKLDAERRRQDASEARQLQARFEALHACKLLSDDELYILENLVVDNLEESKRSGGEGESHTVSSLVRLSEHVASDAGLARQLRRKYL